MLKLSDEDTKQLRQTFKYEPLDPAWPIQSPEHAIELCMEWDQRERGEARDPSWYVYALGHSHAGEQVDLEKWGYDKVYEKSEYTKYVSISWHLAGRYEYDNELIKLLPTFKGLGADDLDDRPRLIDFGAAPWVQALFYYQKGFDVWVVNKALDSEVNRFGRFLAEKTLGTGRVADIIQLEPDDLFDLKDGKFDVTYAVDVLEHIPPEEDGTPGWTKYADQLYRLTKPGGCMYLNAPLDKAEDCHPVDYHVVHFTSPISLDDWGVDKDFTEKGYFLRRRAG